MQQLSQYYNLYNLSVICRLYGIIDNINWFSICNILLIIVKFWGMMVDHVFSNSLSIVPGILFAIIIIFPVLEGINWVFGCGLSIIQKARMGKRV